MYVPSNGRRGGKEGWVQFMGTNDRFPHLFRVNEPSPAPITNQKTRMTVSIVMFGWIDTIAWLFELAESVYNWCILSPAFNKFSFADSAIVNSHRIR